MVLWLSPMESVTDLGFRTLCHKQGASLTFTEMLFADSIVRNNQATMDIIDSYDPTVPTGIQLLASKKETLQKTLDILRQGIESNDGKFSNLQCVDLNFGCPSKEVINAGAGPALLKRTAKMKEILSTLKKHSPLRVGIKIRLGLNEVEKRQKVYLRVIEIANDVGLDYVTVHPKVASDSSNAPIDTAALQEIIDHAAVPIIGNGFVVDGKSAKAMLDMGCFAVMIARAAVANPFIFSDINSFLQGEPAKLRSLKDYETAWKEYDLIAKRHGTKLKFYEFHKRMFSLRMKGDMSYHAPSRILEW